MKSNSNIIKLKKIASQKHDNSFHVHIKRTLRVIQIDLVFDNSLIAENAFEDISDAMIRGDDIIISRGNLK